MGALVQVQLEDDLKSIVDRHVAEGRAASEADYLAKAVRRYAEDLEAETELIAIGKAGIAEIEAGQYTLIETEADMEALHNRIMGRVRATLAAGSA
jgi:Arc/MetJ-type ribon-helix-helix transcriptional regulator